MKSFFFYCRCLESQQQVMSLQLIPSNSPSQAINHHPVTPVNNDTITLNASLFLYGDGRLLVNNVINTTDFILWTEGK